MLQTNNYNYQQQQVNFRNNDDQQYDHHHQPPQQQEINAMDGTNCVMCFQLAMDLSVKEEEIRALKEEKQQEIEILRKEIEKLRLENETLKKDNMRMKKERKQNQKREEKIVTQPQQPQLFGFGQHLQQPPQIPSRISPPQQQQQTVIYFNRSGAEASSSSASPRKLPSASQEIIPENRNTLNLASKSVLLKQDNTEKQNNSPKQTPIRRNTEQRQEVIRVVDPLEYGNREQFNQALPNQRNVFGGFPRNPIVEKNPNPGQQNLRQQQPRLNQIPRVPQPPTVQQPNNSIHDDFEYAKKLQEELFSEEFNQLDINEDNFSPPNHYLHNHLFPLQHNHLANQLILQPFANQQQQDDDLDSYEHNLEAYQDVVVPLKREIWNKLPTSQLISGEECTICYSDVCKGQRSTTLPCKHFFHTECIGKWFERKHTCPVCRYDLQ